MEVVVLAALLHPALVAVVVVLTLEEPLWLAELVVPGKSVLPTSP